MAALVMRPPVPMDKNTAMHAGALPHTRARLRHPAARPVIALMLAATLSACGSGPPDVPEQMTRRLVIRGQPQTLRLSGARNGDPVIVSSGDGGWIHLAPHVAEVLSRSGYFVVGFDTRAYLASFTSAGTTLKSQQEPVDYRTLIEFASSHSGKKPTLIGVSEGAGLSVLAATDPETKRVIAGVIGLGLPDLNELGWRWRDWMIYLTHGLPNEPAFSAAAIVRNVAPLPLGAIHSTVDEFVPLSEVQRIIKGAGEPKRLWMVKASDHSFSDNRPEFDRCLMEAMAWVKQKTTR
jgi:pimeloyl-ACP methyl ester carboxylesterase